jgi:4-hydroxy-4-methyl-2-oxoglutarate aldolase
MKDALKEELNNISTAALADADKGLRVMDAGLRPVTGGQRMVGTARTVRCGHDFLTVITALDQSEPGDVLVVDTEQCPRAVVGELFSREAQRRGLAGLVIDGLVRDTKAVGSLSLPVWSRGFCPCSATTTALRETQIEIRCGGVSVLPGDIVVADDDGILVATALEFERLVPLARDIERKEAELCRRMAAGTGLLEMLNYREHANALASGEESRLAFRLED